MAKRKSKKKESDKSRKSIEKSLDKKEVCEIFEIEKKGKEKVIKTCGTEEEIPATKEQIKNENKILRNLLIGVGIFILVAILIILGINSIKHFEYEGIKFDVVKEGNLIFYRTSVPIIYNKEVVPYNFYLRNDPRKLNTLIDGEINFKENMVFEVTTEELFCEGDWNLAMGNLINLYGLLGINVVKDENATCDEQGRYMFVRIQESNKTNIEQFGPACYNLNVNNCEILKVAEQLMIETFIKFNER